MAQQTLATPIRLKYQAFLWLRDGMYVAAAQPLDVISGGPTREDALRNLEEVIQLFLEDTLERGTLADILEETGYVKVGDAWEAPKITSTDQVTELTE
jgi:predicted RNase H-like HicB family nuclease